MPQIIQWNLLRKNYKRPKYFSLRDFTFRKYTVCNHFVALKKFPFLRKDSFKIVVSYMNLTISNKNGIPSHKISTKSFKSYLPRRKIKDGLDIYFYLLKRSYLFILLYIYIQIIFISRMILVHFCFD